MLLVGKDWKLNKDLGRLETGERRKKNSASHTTSEGHESRLFFFFGSASRCLNFLFTANTYCLDGDTLKDVKLRVVPPFWRSLLHKSRRYQSECARKFAEEGQLVLYPKTSKVRC